MGPPETRPAASAPPERHQRIARCSGSRAYCLLRQEISGRARYAEAMNPKGDLIARLMALGLGAPTFDATAEGPPHERVFHVMVSASGRVLGQGEGRSKRDAERAAAEAALARLDGRGEAPAGRGGRWPIYAAVLEGALEVALELAPDDATLDDVREDAARLYRDLLADLGHGPEEA
ncbi:double-stranded RNA binding protein [Deinococcus geothermalis DSM 11300]|uniref:Double-stranded RNA binding protein n=2 Tax=Deinococcus geothermalis TaxID=68909 RepID=Q1IX47_DEIGD|nr:double-stranded RNA binding protein [Deinococcus geothermalis DSM 11300]